MESVADFLVTHQSELVTIGSTLLGLNVIPDRYERWLEDRNNVFYRLGAVMLDVFGPRNEEQTN